MIPAPRRRPAGRIALLLLLLAIAAVAGSRAVRRARLFAAAEATCAAAERGDWQQALAAGGAPSDTSVAGLRASECRCVALVASRRAPECVALLEDLLADAGIGDWLPRPELLAGLVEQRRQRGDVAGAVRLAGAGADRYPTSEPLLQAEAALRLQLEGLRALDRLALRLEKAGPAASPLRITLAHGAAAHEDWERATRLLGEKPPSGPRRPEWYVLRMQAMAGAGRAEELLAAAEEWAASDGPELPRAYYAYLLTTNHLNDPRRRSALALLLEAIELARRGEADLVVMRVASFDLLTHSLLPGTAAAGQDDGVPALFGVYRLADRRLGELVAQLDGNDVLAVMSDHGARTALQHDRQALFVAAGAGLGPGRSEGRPALAGIPRWIAGHFGVATPWPATGVAPASGRAAHGG